MAAPPAEKDQMPLSDDEWVGHGSLVKGEEKPGEAVAFPSIEESHIDPWGNGSPVRETDSWDHRQQFHEGNARSPSPIVQAEGGWPDGSLPQQTSEELPKPILLASPPLPSQPLPYLPADGGAQTDHHLYPSAKDDRELLPPANPTNKERVPTPAGFLEESAGGSLNITEGGLIRVNF